MTTGVAEGGVIPANDGIDEPERNERLFLSLGRRMSDAAEEVAARPRGQQLFRQVDRVMDIGEHLARTVSRALDPFRRASATDYGKNRWGEKPMPLRTAIPLLVFALPPFLMVVTLLMLPRLPFLIPAIIFKSRQGRLSALENFLPTPGNCATFLWRWRRRLRGIRFSGLRKMRAIDRPTSSEGEDSSRQVEVVKKDSFLAKLLVWWPITCLALAGEMMGLGGPFVFPEPLNLPKAACLVEVDETPEVAICDATSPDNVTPRKRKLPDSDVLTVHASSSQSAVDVTVEPGSGGESQETKPPSISEGVEVREAAPEEESDSDVDSSWSLFSVPKQLGSLKSLLSTSPLSSEDEEDDPDYVPDPYEEEDDDDDTEEDTEDDIEQEEEEPKEEMADGGNKDGNKIEHPVENPDNDKTLTPGTSATNLSPGRNQ